MYGLSAAASLAVVARAGIPQYREWGRVAFWSYLAGAAVAAAMLGSRARFRSRFGLRGRAWVAAAVFAGAALLPLGLEVIWRAGQGPGSHAQSEVIVTEEAARALVHGHDPYAATYVHGPLAARPLGTKTHFPYLPAMLVFGLPRAAGADGAIGDARLWFTAASLALLAWAGATAQRPSVRSSPRTGAADDHAPREGERILLAAQIVLVAPTGAMLLATGGDDLPVMALMILSLALATRNRWGAGGLAAGLASAAKQTAWLLLPFLMVAAWRRGGWGALRRFGIGALVPIMAVVLPAALWNPGAFVEDAVRYPLGLGRQPSPAGTATLGTLALHALPLARGPATAILVAVPVALALYLLLRRPPADPRWAGLQAAAVFTVGFLLAPAARVGYLVYPIDLLAVCWALGGLAPGPAEGEEPGATMAHPGRVDSG